jgi:hypothetical protein
MKTIADLDVAKLREFFQAVAKLTLDHDVIDDHACVTAARLGAELEKVDPEWSIRTFSASPHVPKADVKKGAKVTISINRRPGFVDVAVFDDMFNVLHGFNEYPDTAEKTAEENMRKWCAENGHEVEKVVYPGITRMTTSTRTVKRRKA